MTAELKLDGTIELVIEREFNYPPEQVFDAWLEPEQLIQWMGPTDEINISDISLNAVEGGSYHMQFNSSDGEINKLNGVYQTIQRYTQLIFTWIWEPPTDGADIETLVTLDFTPTSKGTHLKLTHQRFESSEIRDRHTWGWDETLNKLERRAKHLFK